MQGLRLFQVLLVLFLLGTSNSFADHMNGQYSGKGAAAGTMLELQQRGRDVQARLTGATDGTLSGQSDGENNVSGTANITGIGTLQFSIVWSQRALVLRLQGQGGSEEYQFSHGAEATPRPAPNNPPPPPGPPTGTDLQYYVGQGGQQFGPFSQQDILAGLASGEVSSKDLVWTAGMQQWVPIDSLPEFAQNGPPPLPNTPNGPPPLPQNTGNPNSTGLDTEQEKKISAIVLGSTLGILAHELGHALIGEFTIPATGAEEDSADEFSALIMSALLQDTKAMPVEGQQFLTEAINYSTLLWFHDAQKPQDPGGGLPWYDEHSSGMTRFRNTLCMVYGSDPARFGPLADKVELPERERGRCETDFTKRNRAWETIIAPFARNQGGEFPGKLPVNAPGAKVRVSYEPSQTTFGQAILPEFKSLGLFEALATGLEGVLAWNRDFDIVFKDCGTANAFYDPDAAQITMCWEGIEYFFWTVAEPEGIARTTPL